MITAIITSYNQKEYTDEILGYVNENIVHPDEILLIDDCSDCEIDDLLEKYKNLNIRLIKHKHNMGLNFSWNEGLKLAKTKIISVLNNDLVLNKYFFKKILESYDKRNWAIICPFSVLEKRKVLDNDEPVIIKEMGKREGWCWTARKEFINQIDPIPSFLRIYCGDDYIFYCARRKNLPVLKMTNNFIYHYGGRTVMNTKSCYGLLQKEKELWRKYQHEHFTVKS